MAIQDSSTNLLRKSISGGAIAATAVLLQQGVSFGTQVILARLLSPEAFGRFALAWIAASFFASVSHVYGDKYLVRLESVSREQFGTTVTFELVVAMGGFVVMTMASPLIAVILGDPDLTASIAVLAVFCFYQPLSRPRALLERDLDFLRARSPAVIANVLAAIAAVLMALGGLGYWSLIAWRLLSYLVEAAILWVVAPQHLLLSWDANTREALLHLGLPLVGSGLLIFFYWNFDYYLVGRLLGETELGYYWLAFQMSHYLLQIRTTINGVSYPLFARLREPEKIAPIYRALTIATTVFYLLPATVLLVVGEPLVATVFGVEWAPATPILQLFSIIVVLRGASAYWEPVLLVFGRSRLLLVLTAITAAVVLLLGPPMTYWYGSIGMATVVLISVGAMIATGYRFIHDLLDVSLARLIGSPLLVGLALAMVLEQILRAGPSMPLMQLAAAVAVVTVTYSAIMFAVYRSSIGRAVTALKSAWA